MTTLLLVPYLPRTSETLLGALAKTRASWPSSARARRGQAVERVQPLFPKIETGG